MNGSSWLRVTTGAAIALGGSSLMRISACTGDLGVEFRTAAGDSIQQGVQSIVTGVVDGLFSVLDPEPQENGL